MKKANGNALARINLSETQRQMVYRLYAEWRSPVKIRDNMKSKYGVEISETSISSICRTDSAESHVNRYRELFLAKIKEVPIANKRIRLDELEQSRQLLLDMVEKLDINDKNDRVELSMLIRRMNETLCVAREEMEAKPLLMQQINISQFSGMSDEELERKKEELIMKISGNRIVDRIVDEVKEGKEENVVKKDVVKEENASS